MHTYHTETRFKNIPEHKTLEEGKQEGKERKKEECIQWIANKIQARSDYRIFSKDFDTIENKYQNNYKPKLNFKGQFSFSFTILLSQVLQDWYFIGRNYTQHTAYIK